MVWTLTRIFQACLWLMVMRFYTVRRHKLHSGVPRGSKTFLLTARLVNSRFWLFYSSLMTVSQLWVSLTLVELCFQVGSYAYDETKMIFNASLLSYDDSLRNTILDYNVILDHLKPKDSLFIWQSIGNYSLTGFEMTLRRNSLKYLVNYYLPSGLFVVVSWVYHWLWHLWSSYWSFIDEGQFSDSSRDSSG